MFEDKLFRYKEFSIPFAAYRGDDLSREDFLQIIREVRDLQNEQHEALLATVEEDFILTRDHPEVLQSIREVVNHFDEAVDIAEAALTGPLEEEEELFDDALEIFKKGNLLLSDAYYDIDDIWERSGDRGTL